MQRFGKAVERIKNPIRFAAFLLCLCCLIFPAEAKEETGYIALTFDDGPAGKITNKLLDGLAQRQVQATFFLCCYRVENYPELVQRMAKDGHETGIHGCSHKHFTQLSQAELQKELTCTGGRIEALTGVSPTLVRPPGGLYNDAVLQTAAENSLSVIHWSVDPEDWDPAQRTKTVKRVTEKVKHGDIVLLHDLSCANVQSALQIIDELHARGFRFCTVSQLAEMSGTELEPGKVYRKLD